MSDDGNHTGIIVEIKPVPNQQQIGEAQVELRCSGSRTLACEELSLQGLQLILHNQHALHQPAGCLYWSSVHSAAQPPKLVARVQTK